MKLYLVILCISVVFAGEKDSSSEELDFGFLESLLTFDDKKQMHKAHEIFNKTQEKCPNLKTDAKGVMEKVAQCIEKIDIGSNTVCKTVQKNLPKCTQPIIDLLTPCIEEKYQYALPLTIKLIEGFIGQACISTVEELLELANPCVFQVDEDEENKIESCKRINEKIKDDPVPTKEAICGMKSDGHECIKKLTDACKNPLTKKVSVKFSKLGDDIIAEECGASAARGAAGAA